MSHHINHVVIPVNKLAALINLAEALLLALPDEPGGDRERAEQQLLVITRDLLDPESPFLRHRKAILARAELQQLVLFIFGGERKINFFFLFGSFTQDEVAIALECIASYSANGETDQDFMRLAAEIRDLQQAAA